MLTKLVLIFFSVIAYPATAQKKWAGPTNGYWADARNWQPQGVPAMSEHVVLDNTYQKNSYQVTLPDTTVSISLLSLVPAPGNDIVVSIAASNKSNPALIVSDTGTSFNIKSGGVFRNSSALSSGQSIQLGGLISIFNGGRYIHNSRSSHATEIVARLGVADGLEKGVFEFDVPGGSYPISISNRIYGTLVLSSGASGGTQTYNASGSGPVIIKGDYQLNEGVQFNLDLTRDMVINGDFIQKGAVFNLASQPNTNTIKIKGDIIQSATASLTETSTGLPVVELCGDQKQLVSFAGRILNSIALKINNRQGVALTNPLTLPYHLLLANGTIKTSKSNILTVLAGATASGGSVNSFVDGPMKKLGDDDFEFPVGKQGNYAPMKIAGTGGAPADEFLGEYFLGNPGQVYGYTVETASIVRISKQEYWLLERLAGSSSKKVTVSVGNYSNATDLAKLVLVRWDFSSFSWKSEGNSFYSGIATGTLVSNEVNTFGAFTLGSTVMIQNPLLVGGREAALPVIIAPLPNAGTRYLQVQAASDEPVTIVIADIAGRRLNVVRINLFKGFNKIPIPLAALAKGTYFFSLYDKTGRMLTVQPVLRM